MENEPLLQSTEKKKEEPVKSDPVTSAILEIGKGIIEANITAVTGKRMEAKPQIEDDDEEGMLNSQKILSEKAIKKTEFEKVRAMQTKNAQKDKAALEQLRLNNTDVLRAATKPQEGKNEEPVDVPLRRM
jgi:ribosomal protein L13